jgi:hypothetical protein
MALLDIVTKNVIVCGHMSRGSGTLQDIDTQSTECSKMARGNIGALSGIMSMQEAAIEFADSTAAFPNVGDVRDGIAFGWNSALTGTLIVGGIASYEATLLKVTGADARGGSGTCAKLTPTSRVAFGYWYFYLPVTASVPFVFSFWNKISTSWNGVLRVTIYDTDQSTPLLASESVSYVDDGTYHQHSCAQCTPTNTGMCLVRIEIKDGGTTGYVFIDDIGAV